tara:strand:- start:718 stop:1563 length:846 start_codon:yes stop_codon:yes gene_type:complete
MVTKKDVLPFIRLAFNEDIRDGDHSSLACIPSNTSGRVQLIVKDQGIIAGIQLAIWIFEFIDTNIKFIPLKKDGDYVHHGDIVFHAEGSSQSLLAGERLVLNCMQRMSAIATKTLQYVKLVENSKTTILDTRKTTPGIRILEKWAVVIGGGQNHRFGLYDMVMLKDNHIDFAGGIQKALEKTKNYLTKNKINLPIILETRNIKEVKQAITINGIERVMLDNFSIPETIEAVKFINGKIKIESSGGITDKNISAYAKCGVDFISVGALTHSINNMDLSMKAF